MNKKKVFILSVAVFAAIVAILMFKLSEANQALQHLKAGEIDGAAVLKI